MRPLRAQTTDGIDSHQVTHATTEHCCYAQGNIYHCVAVEEFVGEDSSKALGVTKQQKNDFIARYRFHAGRSIGRTRR